MFNILAILPSFLLLLGKDKRKSEPNLSFYRNLYDLIKSSCVLMKLRKIIGTFADEELDRFTLKILTFTKLKKNTDELICFFVNK